MIDTAKQSNDPDHFYPIDVRSNPDANKLWRTKFGDTLQTFLNYPRAISSRCKVLEEYADVERKLLEGQSYSSVAAELGMTMGALKSFLFRGRTILRESSGLPQEEFIENLKNYRSRNIALSLKLQIHQWMYGKTKTAPNLGSRSDVTQHLSTILPDVLAEFNLVVGLHFAHLKSVSFEESEFGKEIVIKGPQIRRRYLVADHFGVLKTPSHQDPLLRLMHREGPVDLTEIRM